MSRMRVCRVLATCMNLMFAFHKLVLPLCSAFLLCLCCLFPRPADVYSSLSKRFTEFQEKNKAAKYQSSKGEPLLTHAWNEQVH
jgi:hypothetical protein